MDTLRATARVAITAGAVAAVLLVLWAGRGGPAFLRVLFVIWVISPFVLLRLADSVSARWPASASAPLRYLTIGIAAITFLLYLIRAMAPPRTGGAVVFVMVPPVSWVLTLAAIGLGVWMSRRDQPS